MAAYLTIRDKPPVPVPRSKGLVRFPERLETFSMQIVHEIPGRLRLRAAGAFDARLAPAFAATLPDLIPGVRDARANPAARSLVVRAQPEKS